MARKPTRRRLGAMRDDPEDLIRLASSELREAELEGSDIGVRQAAEKAHLALTAAVERAIGRPVDGHHDFLEGAKKAGKKLGDEDFGRRLKKVDEALHKKCFYQGVCYGEETVGERVGQAREMISQLARVKPKKHR